MYRATLRSPAHWVVRARGVPTLHRPAAPARWVGAAHGGQATMPIPPAAPPPVEAGVTNTGSPPPEKDASGKKPLDPNRPTARLMDWIVDNPRKFFGFLGALLFSWLIHSMVGGRRRDAMIARLERENPMAPKEVATVSKANHVPLPVYAALVRVVLDGVTARGGTTATPAEVEATLAHLIRCHAMCKEVAAATAAHSAAATDFTAALRHLLNGGGGWATTTTTALHAVAATLQGFARVMEHAPLQPMLREGFAPPATATTTSPPTTLPGVLLLPSVRSEAAAQYADAGLLCQGHILHRAVGVACAREAGGMVEVATDTGEVKPTPIAPHRVGAGGGHGTGSDASPSPLPWRLSPAQHAAVAAEVAHHGYVPHMLMHRSAVEERLERGDAFPTLRDASPDNHPRWYDGTLLEHALSPTHPVRPTLPKQVSLPDLDLTLPRSPSNVPSIAVEDVPMNQPMDVLTLLALYGTTMGAQRTTPTKAATPATPPPGEGHSRPWWDFLVPAALEETVYGKQPTFEPAGGPPVPPSGGGGAVDAATTAILTQTTGTGGGGAMATAACPDAGWGGPSPVPDKGTAWLLHALAGGIIPPSTSHDREGAGPSAAPPPWMAGIPPADVQAHTRTHRLRLYLDMTRAARQEVLKVGAATLTTDHATTDCAGTGTGDGDSDGDTVVPRQWRDAVANVSQACDALYQASHPAMMGRVPPPMATTAPSAPKPEHVAQEEAGDGGTFSLDEVLDTIALLSYTWQISPIYRTGQTGSYPFPRYEPRSPEAALLDAIRECKLDKKVTVAVGDKEVQAAVAAASASLQVSDASSSWRARRAGIRDSERSVQRVAVNRRFTWDEVAEIAFSRSVCAWGECMAADMQPHMPPEAAGNWLK